MQQQNQPQQQQQQQTQPQKTSQTGNGATKENEWNQSDNSNHSQIAITTQRGDFLVEQIKSGVGGEQSTYFLSPINSNKVLSTLKNDISGDYSLNPLGNLQTSIVFFFLSICWTINSLFGQTALINMN